jgi:transposase InsO family protein
MCAREVDPRLQGWPSGQPALGGLGLVDHMRTELVSDTLSAAFGHQAPTAGVIFHSDRGSQSSTRPRSSGNWPLLGEWCSLSAARRIASIAEAESFWATLKRVSSVHHHGAVGSVHAVSAR